MADIKVGREIIRDVQLVVFDKDGTLIDSSHLLGNMGVNANFRASIGVASGLTSAKRLLEITPFVVSGIAEVSFDF